MSLVSTGVALTTGVLIGAWVENRGGFTSALALARTTARAVGVAPESDPRHLDDQSNPVPKHLVGQLQLFVLAGQSNMSGLGNLPAAQPTHPHVFVFGNDYRWRIGVEPVDGEIGQVDEVSLDAQAGFGPGMAFALALTERFRGSAIGLIPCAKGASEITQWQRDLSDDALYGSCLKRVRAASTLGRPAGLLFFQGEADAVDPRKVPDRAPAPTEYAEKFASFVDDFRRDLGAMIPIVYAQIGTHAAPEYFTQWDLVKQQQQSVALRCAAMIKTEDLPLRDAVHFTTSSYVVIGRRFAQAFTQLARGSDRC